MIHHLLLVTFFILSTLPSYYCAVSFGENVKVFDRPQIQKKHAASGRTNNNRESDVNQDTEKVYYWPIPPFIVLCPAIIDIILGWGNGEGIRWII